MNHRKLTFIRSNISKCDPLKTNGILCYTRAKKNMAIFVEIRIKREYYKNMEGRKLGSVCDGELVLVTVPARFGEREQVYVFWMLKLGY